ncbi:MAG: heparinase II/III family protein, partial [Clostridia bacterium]|nr:heparinase II/III family protein [Clostridia bacterium]
PVEYDNNFGYIDLFAAETAADLSIVCHFLGDRFDEDIRDIVNGKIVFSIKKRIIEPFVKYDDMIWMGFKGNTVGNWCPWITSNILLATALTEDNLRTRQLVVEKALKCLDNFIGGYDPDGGCSEGPMYWGHAGEALFDALEILYDMSGGIIDKFDTPIIGAICDYIRKVNICGNYYTCFADCHPEANPEIKAVYRMGKKTGNKLLCNFAKNEIKNGFGKYNERIFGLIRIIKDGVYPIDEKTDNYKPNYVECLPDLQVAVLRSERKPDAKFIIGIKGGHNGEQHNHIDVGNFVLYNNGKPFIIDLGICTYTKALFDDRRYTVFPVYGKAHNLPVINDKGEVEGIDYAATSFDADENLKAVKVSYKNAYENRDEIELCERTVKVSDKCVTVSEDVVLKENGNCLFNYYLYEKPEILNNNTAVFQNGLKINVTGGVLCAEDVELKDDRLIKDWKKDVLYKLVVKPENGKEFHVKIKAMKNN